MKDILYEEYITEYCFFRGDSFCQFELKISVLLLVAFHRESRHPLFLFFL